MDDVFIKTQLREETVGQDNEHRPPSWHASFACKVKLRPGEDWLKMRWGFNAGLLIEEALDRARLFVESQCASELASNRRSEDQRTLSLRCRVRPNEGLTLAIMGKVCADTETDARQNLSVHYREICSVFPQDFVTYPAKSQEEYQELSGSDILQANGEIAQLKRFEQYLPAKEGMQYVHGLWQSSTRSHEQIWRALAKLAYPTLFSITIRPINIYPFELELFEQLNKSKEIPKIDEKRFPISYKNWNEVFINRRTTPLRKFFYLQIHLTSPRKLDDNILRSIGTALTRDTSDSPIPGFKVIRPSQESKITWVERLNFVDLTPPVSEYDPQHLSDIADMEEVAGVFRYPYPHPETGLPGVYFEIAPKQFKDEDAEEKSG